MRGFFFNDTATGYEWGAPVNASGAGGHGWAPMTSDSLCGGRRRLCVHMCSRVRVGACEYACVRTRGRVCVYARMRVCMRD